MEGTRTCQICERTYCSEKALEIHLLTKKHKKYEKEGKPKKYNSPGRPKGTRLQKTIECETCGKMISSNYHLRRHKETHKSL